MQNKFTHDNSIPKVGNRIKINYGDNHFQDKYQTLKGNNRQEYNNALDNTPSFPISRAEKEMMKMKTIVSNSERGSINRNVLNLHQPSQSITKANFEEHEKPRDIMDYTYTDFHKQAHNNTPMMAIPSSSITTWDASNKSHSYYNQYHQDKLIEIANSEKAMQIAIDQQYKAINQPLALNEIGLNAYQVNDVMDPRVLNQYVQQTLENQRQEQLQNLERAKHPHSNVDRIPNFPNTDVYSNEPPQPLRLQRPEAPLINGIDPLINPFEEKQKINKIAHQLKDPNKPIYSLRDATPAKKRVYNEMSNNNKMNINNKQNQKQKQKFQAYDPNYVSNLENEALFSVSDIVNNWNKEIENKNQLANIPANQAKESKVYINQVNNNRSATLSNDQTVNYDINLNNNNANYPSQKSPINVVKQSLGSSPQLQVNPNNQRNANVNQMPFSNNRNPIPQRSGTNILKHSVGSMAPRAISPVAQQRTLNNQMPFSNNRNTASQAVGGNILKRSIGSMAPRTISPVAQQRTLNNQMPFSNNQNNASQSVNGNILKHSVGSMAPRTISPVAQQKTLSNQMPFQKKPSNNSNSIFNRPDYRSSKPLLKDNNSANPNVHQPQIKPTLSTANNYNHNRQNLNQGSQSMERAGVSPLYTPYGETKKLNTSYKAGAVKLSPYAASNTKDQKAQRPINNGSIKLSSYATSHMKEQKAQRPINNGSIKLSSYATSQIKTNNPNKPINKGPVKLSSYAAPESSVNLQNTTNENSPIVKELAPNPENKK